LAPDPRTDAELVRAAARGDEPAFLELYQRHRDFVFALALRHCGNREDALDLAQEAFAGLFKRLPTLELTGKLSTYLYPHVVHRAIDLRRRRSPSTGDEAAFAAACAASAAPEAEHPSERLAHEDLLRWLAGVPAEQREVLWLRFAADLELAEIATALAIPLGTVKSRMHAALKLLRGDPRLARLAEDD